MADLLTRLKLESDEFNNNIEESKNKVKGFQEEADKTNKSLNDMSAAGAKSTKELLAQMTGYEKAGRSASNYKKQLAQVQKEIADLTIGYRNMSSEMKNSPIGQEVVAKIQELTLKAANYKDAIGDVQQQISNMASDTSAWDGIKQGIEAATGAIQAFAAAGFLSADSQEKMVKVIAKLQSIQALSNAAIKIGNALQSQSSLMNIVNTAQLKALARAKDLETAATGRATIAQKLFNKVAAANPYVLLAAAVAAVVLAIAGLTAVIKKNKEANEAATRAQNAYNKALKDGDDAAADTVSQYMILRDEYRKLSSDTEINKWLEKNADKFEDLGYSIKDVNEAEEFFNDHTNDIIEAMRLRAQAAAVLKVYQEEYAQAIKDAFDEQKKAEKAAIKGPGGGRLDKKTIQENNLKYGVDYTYTPRIGVGNQEDMYKLTPEGEKKMKEAGKKAWNSYVDGAEESLSEMKDLYDNLLKMADDLDGKYRTKPKNNNDNNNNNKNDEDWRKLSADTKKYLEEQLKLLNEQLPKLEKNTAEWEETLKQINEIEKKIKEINDLEDSFKAKLNRPIGDNIKITPKIEMPQTIPAPKIDIIRLSPDDLVKAYEDAGKRAGDISKYLKIGAISREQADIMIKSINNQLAAKHIHAEVKLDVDEEELNDFQNKIARINDNISRLSGLGNGFGAIKTISDSFKSLNEVLDSNANGFERFFAVLQSGMTILSAFSTLLETINLITKMVNKEKEEGTGLTLLDTIVTRLNTREHRKNAGAKAMEGVAEGTLQALKTPVVGWIIAAVAAASIAAALIASMGKVNKYENGGIIRAASKFGDHNFARVNDGEMILNTRQQDNLFKLLNNSPRMNNENGNKGNVDFKIKGSDLVGVLRNYNDKRGKII